MPAADEENTVKTSDTGQEEAINDADKEAEPASAEPTSDDTTSEEDSGRFDRAREILSGGASTVRGAASNPFSRLSSPGSEKPAEPNGGREEYDDEYDEPSSTRRGFVFALGFGTGAVATGGASVLASDAAEGELGDGEYGVPQLSDLGFDEGGDPGAAANDTGNRTEEGERNPAAPTDEQQTPEQIRPTTTDQPTPELGYKGEIDGRGYEVVDIPGRSVVDAVPEDAAGFKVDEDLLSSYDSDAWYNISSDESGENEYGFDNLGASTEWYVTEDAVIGVDTRDKEVVRFSHSDFGYDTQMLYEDIQEDIQ
jgi:hypothetical protein